MRTAPPPRPPPRRARWRACALAATIALCATTCSEVAALAGGSGRTLCVDAGYDGKASDGSPAKPYRTIQEAIDAARNGETIAVAQGRYENGNIDLRGKALVL